MPSPSVMACSYGWRRHNNGFQYHAPSCLDKHDNHVQQLTIAKCRKEKNAITRYACATQRGAAIPATSACSNSKNIINTCLTGRQQHSSKFSSSKSQVAPFVKILHRQTFVPYGSYIIYAGKINCMQCSLITRILMIANEQYASTVAIAIWQHICSSQSQLATQLISLLPLLGNYFNFLNKRSYACCSV